MAEAVAVVADEVTGTVPEVTGKVSVAVEAVGVVNDVHTIVTVLQARRTYHSHFVREMDLFTADPYQ